MPMSGRPSRLTPPSALTWEPNASYRDRYDFPRSTMPSWPSWLRGDVVRRPRAEHHERVAGKTGLRVKAQRVGSADHDVVDPVAVDVARPGDRRLTRVDPGYREAAAARL